MLSSDQAIDESIFFALAFGSTALASRNYCGTTSNNQKTESNSLRIRIGLQYPRLWASGIWKFEMRPNGRLPDKKRTRDPRNTISDLLSLGRQKRVGYNRQLTRLPAPHQCVFGSIVLFVQGALSFSRGRVCCYRAAIHTEVTAALQTIRAKKTKAETWKRTAGTIGPCGAVEVRAALSKVHIGRMSVWSSSGHCSS